jgi:acetyltransferase-like isoleucine patch superfamily enzyme
MPKLRRMWRAWAYRLKHGRDPRQARFLTPAGLRWMVRHRAFTPWYLLRYWRLAVLRLRRPDVVLEGLVFLGRKVTVQARPGYGRLVIGRWVHVGDLTRLRAHEGTLRVGDKVVIGNDTTVNCYLDIEIGAAALISDWVYVCDFDHVTAEIDAPIKDQGLVKTPVRIGPGCWLGVKTTVLRGTVLGEGCVLAAHAVARGVYPPMSVVAGLPGRVVADRADRHARAGAHREALADMARRNADAVRGPAGVSKPSPPASLEK